MVLFQKPYSYGSKSSNATFVTLNTHVWFFHGMSYLKTFVMMYSTKCNSQAKNVPGGM